LRTGDCAPVIAHRCSARCRRYACGYDAGWEDTVDVRPAEAVEIVTRFTDYAGTFLMHRHNLEHEDTAMMGDFVTA
jgi:FtsP/CotA-like multicopper oxidase with cupredoxin domain